MSLASLGLRCFYVAGVGQCARPRGTDVVGVRQCALPRVRMYVLASLGLRCFCVAGVGQCAPPPSFLRVCVGQCAPPRVGCTPWRPLVSASFAWQACSNVHCQGGPDVRPGVPWFPPLLRGRRGLIWTAKGSDVRPGVPCLDDRPCLHLDSSVASHSSYMHVTCMCAKSR